MRPSIHETFIKVAEVIAERGTCARRKVGCVLTDVKGRIIATGYNGPARGLAHCTDTPCQGANCPSGQGLDKCEAIHAEQNALMQCSNVDQIHACYVTVSPCIHCVKMLMNTGCKLIVFSEEYAHSKEVKELWPWYWCQTKVAAVHPKAFGNISW